MAKKNTIYNNFMQQIGQELIDNAIVEVGDDYYTIDYKTCYKTEEL